MELNTRGTQEVQKVKRNQETRTDSQSEKKGTDERCSAESEWREEKTSTHANVSGAKLHGKHHLDLWVQRASCSASGGG